MKDLPKIKIETKRGFSDSRPALGPSGQDEPRLAKVCMSQTGIIEEVNRDHHHPGHNNQRPRDRARHLCSISDLVDFHSLSHPVSFFASLTHSNREYYSSLVHFTPGLLPTRGKLNTSAHRSTKPLSLLHLCSWSQRYRALDRALSLTAQVFSASYYVIWGNTIYLTAKTPRHS